MPVLQESAAFRTGLLTAVLAFIASVTIGLLVVLSAGFTGSFAEVMTAGVRTWLVSVGSGLSSDSASFTLIPWGAVALATAIVAWAATLLSPDAVDDLGLMAATSAGCLGVAAAVSSALVETSDVRTSMVRAAVGGFAVGGLGSCLGVGMRHGWPQEWMAKLTPDQRVAVRGGVRGAIVLLAFSLALLLLLLILHLNRAGDLWASLSPGVLGGFVLALGCLLTVPTLTLWTASVLVGPGFVLGTETSVDLSGSQLGAVPGLPVLAALPAPGAFPGWVFLLGLLPLFAGAVAGFTARPTETEDVKKRVIMGLAAGALGGGAVGVGIALSGGSIGPGRMAEAGPSHVTPVLIAAVMMGVGGALGAITDHYRGRRAPEPNDPADSRRRPRLWRWNQPSGTD